MKLVILPLLTARVSVGLLSKKDMVIRGGENIYPAELEEFSPLKKDLEAHVFGIPDEKFGEQLVAWIITEKGATFDEATIQNQMSWPIIKF